MKKISFTHCPEFFNPNLKIKDVKKIIRDKTGIKEENQKFRVTYENYNSDLMMISHFLII